MKLKTLLSSTLTALLLFTGVISVSAQALLEENFNYTVGTTLLSNGYVEQGGPSTTNQPSVVTGNLTYTGYASSNIGNMVTLATTGQDVYKTFTTQSSGVVYMAALINITAANTAGDYFLCFKDGVTPVTSYYYGRLYVKKDASDKIAFGINRGSAVTTLAYTNFDYSLNTTYLIVIKYSMVDGATNDVASLFINPTIGAAEPSATLVNTDATSVDATNIGAVLLRQGSNTNAATPSVDGIRVATTWEEAVKTAGVVVDETAPLATLNPATAATGVAINSPITITFDEAIRNIDNSEITNANVASLLSLKEKVSGNAVTFTASIDAAKKVITITPSANLTNSLQYEVGIAPVEDAAGNATVTIASTFTTIGTSVITLTAPNGGEKFYAGQTVDFTWTSTGMDAENVKIEAYVYNNGSATWSWTECIASTANDGSASYTIPADAAYGIQYKIRITGLTSATTDESNAPFTVIATTDNLATLIGLPANSIVKYTGKATVTYARTARNQKYIQDANAAVLIDDATTAPGYIVDAYAIGEGISNIEGKITLYNSLVELVPQATTGEKVTGNPTITPEVRTIASLTHADQCKLVKIEGLTIATPTQHDAGGLFVASKNYDVTGFANTAFVFRTAFSEANYIGTAVPATAQNVVGLVGQFNAVMQISPRNLADITPVTGINDNDVVSTKAYPNPFSTDFKINAGKVVRNVVVSNMLGQKVMERAYNEIEIDVPASDLRTGVYFVTVKFEDGTTSTLRIVKK